jgi:integrase
VTDTNFFPYERYRLYVATILLLAALTGSRPGALLRIMYSDIDLFVLRDRKTGEIALTVPASPKEDQITAEAEKTVREDSLPITTRC